MASRSTHPISRRLSFAVLQDALPGLQKLAGMQADNQDVERAFAEMAYTAVRNKVGPLMTSPNLVGFEVIKKDDDNTRMLGIYVLRLGSGSKDKLVYIPCIYTDGKVVGTELLYRTGAKRFVSNTPEWMQFLVDLSSQSTGVSHAKSESGKLAPQVMLSNLSRMPAAFGKQGSCQEGADAGELETELCRQEKVAALIGDFMTRHGNDAVLDCLQRTIEARPKFARAICELDKHDSFFPVALLERMYQEKQAAEAREAALDKPYVSLLQGRPSLELLKSAADADKATKDIFTQGYHISMDPAHEAEATEVFDAPDNGFVSPGTNGVVTVVAASGERIRALAGNHRDGYELTEPYRSVGCCSPLGMPAGSRIVCALEKSDSGTMWQGSDDIWTEDGAAESAEDIGVPAAEVDKGLYLFFSPHTMDVYGPVWVLGNKEHGTIRHLTVSCWPNSTGSLLVLNPDADQPKRGNVIDGSWRCLKVPHEKDSEGEDTCCSPASSSPAETYDKAPGWRVKPLTLASAADIRAEFERNPDMHLKRASLRRTGDAYIIEVEGNASGWLSRRDMHIKMAAQLGLHPEAAAALLDRVNGESNVTRVVLRFPAHLKAAALQIVDTPVWQTDFDPVQGVPAERAQAFGLRTMRTPFYLPASRIGDKVDSVRGVSNDPRPDEEGHWQEILQTEDPENIAQFAITKQMPNVFDHAVLGSLSRAYDSATFLESYIPKLEEGLDALGRCIFLFYWKPQDWRNLYGLDDLQELEDQLLSVFRSQGDLVLALLKKSRTSGATAQEQDA